MATSRALATTIVNEAIQKKCLNQLHEYTKEDNITKTKQKTTEQLFWRNWPFVQ